MKLYRVSYQGEVFWAQEGSPEELILLKEPPFAGVRPSETRVPLGEVRLLTPATPSKIVAIGRNYVAHAKELGNEVPKEPLLFLKPPSALLDPEGIIRLPPESQRVEHEAELAVVIGKRARRVSREDALNYALGYTCANDVTARDLQRRDVQFTRGKGFDTFCPLGPCLDTEVHHIPRRITCRVNGELRQNGITTDMVFGVAELLSYISQIMTLEPGDVILTGTPEGVGPLRSGDQVEIEIEGIGRLQNRVSE